MKQGSGNNSDGGRKIEPRSHAVPPAYAGEIGVKSLGAHAPMTEGRGLKAPMASFTTHQSGSQGRHK